MKKLLLFLLFAPLIAWAQPTPAGGPPPASQAEVDAGVVANKYVSPLTLDNWSGGGGGGTWGSITGTLSNQTDLQAALDAKGNLAGGNSWTGVQTFPGSFIRTPATITLTANAGTLDVTKGYQPVTLTANSTLAPSSGTATAGRFVTTQSINAQATSLTQTMNNAGTDYVNIIPVGFKLITYVDTGSGDLVPIQGDPQPGTSAAGSLLYLSNPTTRVDFTDEVSDVATVIRATIVEKIAVFSVDGGGAAISTGTVSGTARIPYACTLTGWSITATAASGTTTIKIWNVATGTAIPAIGNVINTNGVSLSSGTAVASATITDFTDTTYAALDMMRCAITAVDGTATDLTVTLYGTRL